MLALRGSVVDVRVSEGCCRVVDCYEALVRLWRWLEDLLICVCCKNGAGMVRGGRCRVVNGGGGGGGAGFVIIII